MSIVWVVDVLCNVILLVRGYGVGIMWLWLILRRK
jgi:hypothetical protein